MEFALSESERLVQESAHRILDSVCNVERLLRLAGENSTMAGDVWSGIVELGITSMLVPEEYSGLGLSKLEAALVAEVLGQYVAPVPFVASVVMAPIALVGCASPMQQGTWLPAVASGELKIGVGISEHAAGARDGAQLVCNGSRLNGRSLFVLDFECADAFIVADRAGSLYWINGGSSGLTRRALPTVDITRSVGELILEDVEAELLPEGDSQTILRRMVDAGRVMLAADTLGAAQAMIGKAVAYAKERVQFGRPIGAFQAVKHMCAEMTAELEPARSLVWYSGFALDQRTDEASLMAAHAKAHLSEVGTFIARTATEVHGGIGFTDLLGLHYWFKRINANRHLLGGPRFVRDDAAKLQGLSLRGAPIGQ